MVGDVNLFFNDSSDPALAEVEVMIAGDLCNLSTVIKYHIKFKNKHYLSPC